MVGGGGDEADLGGEGEIEGESGGEGEIEGESGGEGEPDLGGGGEDEFHADLGGRGGQEGVFGTKVDIEVEVHSWVDSETEDEEFVDIPVSVMGDINNCDNDVASVTVEVGITEEENQSECEQRGDLRKYVDRGLSNDQWQSDELLSGGETDCESLDDDTTEMYLGCL